MASNQAKRSWFNRSLDVIRSVLDRLPPTATFAEKRKAVSAAYPFGPRKHHPYKQWLLALKQMLPITQPPIPDPKYTISRDADCKLCIKVVCHWCNNRTTGWRNCLACFPLLDHLDKLEADVYFVRGLQAVRDDVSAAPIFADWLAERGESELESLMRRLR